MICIFFLYLIYVQYDDSEDAPWLEEESEDTCMGYLEMLNVRFVCQILSLITMIIASAKTIFSTSVFVHDLTNFV